MATVAKNPYLEGAFAPVQEETTAFDLPVEGSIPDHLDGRYLRIGPNPLGEVDPASYHWFMGNGMVHGVRLRDGRAEWYRNRWIRNAETARALGEPPRPGPVFGADFPPNTNVIGHAGRTFALVEGGSRPYELTDELDTVGPSDFDGTLECGYTAHPKRDPATGELHAMSYFWGWGNKVQYTVLDRAGRVRRSVDVEVSGSPMMHDFSLTERYVVIYDLPVVFDLDFVAGQAPAPMRGPVRTLARRFVGRHALPNRISSALTGSGGSGVNGMLPYKWDPDYPPRVGVLARDGAAGDIRWFDVEPCYVYHPMNAYEDGDRLVLDVVRHPSTFRTDRSGPNEGPPTLDRWTVDLAAGKVTEERIDDCPQEFPRVDERLVGKRHRFGYCVGGYVRPGLGGCVFKHDLVSGATQTATFPDATAGEFVFVPSSEAAAEDSGVLMGFVQRAGGSDLVLLDAGSLDTVALVRLPARVPAGFHGNWVPATA